MPGFPPACTWFYWCPFDHLVSTAAVVTYLLLAEVILLTISVLVARLRRRDIQRGLLALLAIVACALLAGGLTDWLLRINPRYMLGDIHYTPALVLRLRQMVTATQQRMLDILLGVWALFVVGTMITATVLISAVRRPRSPHFLHEHSS